nr:AraC family transcriptional regulator [Pedobacter panaciterrae]
MNSNDISIFYDQYVNGGSSVKNSFSAHFDYLLWEDLQNDLLACERLQRKPFYKIALLRGEAIYDSKDQKIPIAGNTIVFTSPLTRFSFKTIDENFEGRYCVCSERFLRGTSRLYISNWPVFKDRGIYTQSLSNKQYNELLHLFNDIENEYQSDYPLKEELVRNRVFDIIHYTQKLDKNLLEIISGPEESLEERFFKMLENSFISIRPEMPLEGKSPAYFAQLLYTSVDHLNKTMKRVTGKTTLSLIHQRIIEEANILLKHTAYSVKEIAWSLHFQETSHFQNFYKKRTNCTPLEYRNA